MREVIFVDAYINESCKGKLLFGFPFDVLPSFPSNTVDVSKGSKPNFLLHQNDREYNNPSSVYLKILTNKG